MKIEERRLALSRGAPSDPHSASFFRSQQPSPLPGHHSNPSCLDPPSPLASVPGGKGSGPPHQSFPGRTHRGQDAARHQDCHSCQRPGQEPPHACKSAAQALPFSPEDADASPGSGARTGLAHQSSGEPSSAPEGGVIKATSDVRPTD